MPPDISSIDSDISKHSQVPKLTMSNVLDKISALTPFSDQFMPNVTTAGGSDHFHMSGYNPTVADQQRRQQNMMKGGYHY